MLINLHRYCGRHVANRSEGKIAASSHLIDHYSTFPNQVRAKHKALTSTTDSLLPQVKPVALTGRERRSHQFMKGTGTIFSITKLSPLLQNQHVRSFSTALPASTLLMHDYLLLRPTMIQPSISQQRWSSSSRIISMPPTASLRASHGCNFSLSALVSVQHQQRKWMTSKRKLSSDKNEQLNRKKGKRASSGDAPTTTSSTNSTPLPHKVLEERIKLIVDDLNLGDQVSVIAISALLAMIVAAPYLLRYARRSESAYNQEWTTTGDDPVEDFNTWWREHYVNEVIDGDGKNAEANGDAPQNAVEYMLRDVLQSKALKTAAQQFLISILESPEFKGALNGLVKELWTDLVTDAETVAQVIQLLQKAIQDPAVKQAAQQLVLDLVEEPDVKESLLQLLQRLGRDDAVQDAVVTLLTDSAHTTLNDDEILDHSMEFATDVLGDDIVQRTAGEALRNTVSHAVMSNTPSASILLTAAGIGLLIFGVVAAGYARSTEQEAAILEVAARSLHSKAGDTCFHIFVTWPKQMATAVLKGVLKVVMLPVDVLQSILSSVVTSSWSAITGHLTKFSALPGQWWHSLAALPGRWWKGLTRSLTRHVHSLIHSTWSVSKRSFCVVSFAVQNGVATTFNSICAALSRTLTSLSSVVRKSTSETWEAIADLVWRLRQFFSKDQDHQHNPE